MENSSVRLHDHVLPVFVGRLPDIAYPKRHHDENAQYPYRQPHVEGASQELLQFIAEYQEDQYAADEAIEPVAAILNITADDGIGVVCAGGIYQYRSRYPDQEYGEEGHQ